MHYLDANKTAGEEARRQLHKNASSNFEQVLEATPHKTPIIRPPTSHHENYPSLTNQTRRTLLEKQGRAHKWCTTMDPHIWPSKSRTSSSRHICSSYVRIRDVALKTCQRRWTIWRSGERGYDMMRIMIYIYIYIYIYIGAQVYLCGRVNVCTKLGVSV